MPKQKKKERKKLKIMAKGTGEKKWTQIKRIIKNNYEKRNKRKKEW